MKRALTSFVAVLCLLAFTVSSAACLTAATQPQAHPSSAHSITSSEHACCPNQAPGPLLSNSCCAIHHQPASSTSSDTDQQAATPSLSQLDLLIPHSVATHPVATPSSTPLRQPLLISLRI